MSLQKLTFQSSFADTVAVLPYFRPNPYEHEIVQGTMYPTVPWSASMSSSGIPAWHPPAQMRSHPYGQSSAQQISVANNSFRMDPHSKTADYQPFGTTAGTTSDVVLSSEPGENEATRRARYAANQRHSKSQQRRRDNHQNEGVREADDRVAESKRRRREKNKLAAAKHRLRQRKN